MQIFVSVIRGKKQTIIKGILITTACNYFKQWTLSGLPVQSSVHTKKEDNNYYTLHTTTFQNLPNRMSLFANWSLPKLANYLLIGIYLCTSFILFCLHVFLLQINYYIFPIKFIKLQLYISSLVLGFQPFNGPSTLFYSFHYFFPPLYSATTSNRVG